MAETNLLKLLENGLNLLLPTITGGSFHMEKAIIMSSMTLASDNGPQQWSVDNGLQIFFFFFIMKLHKYIIDVTRTADKQRLPTGNPVASLFIDHHQLTPNSQLRKPKSYKMAAIEQSRS